jgi:two-component system LytT family response regulator
MNAILIDDEPNAVGLLALRLKQYCPQISIVAACTNSLEGIEAIKTYKPDLVFLDIEMPQLNGFQVLEAVQDIPFSLVFVTAYDKFALKAFRYSAIDYLLKPIDTQELIQAVEKVEKQRTTSPDQIEHLKSQVNSPDRPLPDTLALPYQNGVAFVALNDIIYCKSDDNYTRFFVVNDQHYLVMKPLKDIQALLEERDFLRIHRQYIINLNQTKKFVRGESSYLLMANGQSLSVSRSYRDRLIERFKWL